MTTRKHLGSDWLTKELTHLTKSNPVMRKQIMCEPPLCLSLTYLIELWKGQITIPNTREEGQGTNAMSIKSCINHYISTFSWKDSCRCDPVGHGISHSLSSFGLFFLIVLVCFCSVLCLSFLLIYSHAYMFIFFWVVVSGFFPPVTILLSTCCFVLFCCRQ